MLVQFLSNDSSTNCELIGNELFDRLVLGTNWYLNVCNGNIAVSCRRETSSFQIEVKQNVLKNVVKDVKACLSGKSYNADHNTSIFSTSTQSAINDLVEDIYSVCLGSETKVATAIEVTDGLE